MSTVSVVIPIYNAKATILKALKSLFLQDYPFNELILVNDASNDGSGDITKDFLESVRGNYIQRADIKFIDHQKSCGLAASYNDGIKNSTSDFIITMHADVIVKDGALKKLIVFFSEDNSDIVASTHVVDHPIEIWEQYNFWQKCFFARLVGKKFSGIDGKFDCFKKSALEKVGMFDAINFRVAGEDGDLVAKISKIGKIVKTEAEIIHLHKIDTNFSWRDIIYKQKQYSEAQGALFRKGRIKEPLSIIKSFFREILLIAFLVPYVWTISAVLMVIYSFWYTWKVYKSEWKDWRILILPLFNLLLLPISLWYSSRGFIYGKQRI
jgi:glycosyltransferase involved in cell wall biosynthesis